VLLATPWLRAPLLPRRSPAVLAAVLGAGLVLGTAAAATPVFLSSAGNAMQARQLGERCGWLVRTGFPVPVGPAASDAHTPSIASLDQAARRAGAAVPNLQPPVLTMVAEAGTTIGPADRPAVTGAGRVLYRDGAFDNVELLAGDRTPGVWVSDAVSGRLGLRPGTRLRMASAGGEATVRVSGVYRDLKTGATLTSSPRSAFWCSQAERIYQPGPFSDAIPPPLVLADRATFESLGAPLGLDNVEVSWDFALRPGTLADSEATVAALPAYEEAVAAGLHRDRVTHSDLPFVTRRSAAVVTALRAAVAPVAVAGTLVALLLVVAAGSYWADRRRLEVRLLAAKGVGPAAIGAKAVLELAAPAVVGGVAGWGAAVGLVRLLGPSALLDPAGIRRGLWLALAAVVLGIVLLGVLAAVRARSAADAAPAATRAGRRPVPWELAVLALAGVALWRLVDGPAGPGPSASGDTAPRVDLLALAFPLLFLAGSVRLAARPLGARLRRLRGTGGGWPAPLYLAARRLAGSVRPALVLFAAAALSVGVGIYAAALTGSVRATLDAKAGVFVGGDIAVPLLEPSAAPPGVTGTTVARSSRATADGSEVELLGVDRATFARGAFWDAGFSGRSLDDLMELLTPVPGRSAPALVAGPGVSDAPSIAPIGRGAEAADPIQVTVVARPAAFPGQRALTPLVVVDRTVLEASGASIEYQLWAEGEQDEVLAAVTAAGLPAASYVVDVARVLDVSSFLTTSWTFGFLQALGVLTGSIALGGLLLYVETRARARRVSYALSRRMGLGRRAHAAALAIELGVPLTAGLVAGAALAMVAAGLVYPTLDSLPNLPPGPLLRVPWLVLAGSAVAVVAVALLAAAVAQRSADRARVGEVLRLAE
jgi:putative ABC transport system permease protein